VSKIFVTGIGLVSAIGMSVDENLYSLRNKRTGISHIELYRTKYSGILPSGEIKISSEKLFESFPGLLWDPRITRTSLLALLASEDAIRDAGLQENLLRSPETALICGTTVGGMCLTDELFHDAKSDNDPTPYVASYDGASVTLAMQKYFGIAGELSTINTACSSSANAIIHGARLMQHGYAKRAIVGGADSLAKFTINGFKALNILSSKHCAPFDRDRDGLNLGEGAAFLVLEKEEDVKGKPVYATLSGFANRNDAYHPSSNSPNGEGPYLSMRKALEHASLDAADISYINAHGTGTENNDETETVAMKRLFEKVPPFSSTKSFTGHTLGAAGAIEAVYSILNIKCQEMYPSLSFQHPIPDIGISPLLEYTRQEINHVMSNSFGFGGNCSTLIFSRP
jgi:3-oxoacyl-(acyl-carrier-protein) synthase